MSGLSLSLSVSYLRVVGRNEVVPLRGREERRDEALLRSIHLQPRHRELRETEREKERGGGREGGREGAAHRTELIQVEMRLFLDRGLDHSQRRAHGHLSKTSTYCISMMNV